MSMVESSLPSLPHVVRRKRTLLIAGAISAVIFVLILLSGLAIWLLRDSAAPLPDSAVPLPAADEQSSRTNATVPEATVSATPAAAPGVIPLSLRIPAFQNNLGVTITYAREPQFTLSLGTVTRTIENPTAARAPVAGSPYSVLRIKDAAGVVIHEQPFAVTTQVELVSADATVAQPLYQLPESATYIVIPVQAQRPPTLVEIASSQGTIIAQKTINFLELPVTPSTKGTISDPAFSAATPVTLWARLRQTMYASAQTNTAPQCSDGADNDGDLQFDSQDPGCHTDNDPTNLASFQGLDNDETDAPPSTTPPPTASPSQTPSPPPPCTSNCFNIVVAGHDAIAVKQLADNTRTMLKSLEPWKTYASQVRVVPVTVPKEHDLRCLTIEGNDGNNYPSCPNDAAIAGAITGVTWHTIIVTTDVNCNCGTVADINTSDVAAVGKNAGAAVVGHELGHSVGRMVDEYYYRFGFQGGPLGPNCFDSEQSCRDATTKFTSAVCSLGCRAVDTWRPSTQKMHSVLASEYGPLEACVMAERIRQVVGGQQQFGECEVPEKSVEPPPPPAREGDYYGGRR